MSWRGNVRSKAAILFAQIEPMRSLAIEHGLDADAVVKPYYDEIDKLYAEEFQFASMLDTSDMVFHMVGPALEDHTPRLSLVSSFFQSITKQVLQVSNSVADMSGRKILDKDLEIALSGLAPGSLYIGVRAEPAADENGQQRIGADPIVEATREAMKAIGLASQYLDPANEELRDLVPDDRVRDAAFVAVSHFAPTGRRGVSKLTISTYDDQRGSVVGEPLTPKLRKELRRQLKDSETYAREAISETQRFELVGEVRELDLDLRRFELRRIDGGDGHSVRCMLGSSQVALHRIVGKRVRVKGVGAPQKTNLPGLLDVQSVVELEPFFQAETKDLI